MCAVQRRRFSSGSHLASAPDGIDRIGHREVTVVWKLSNGTEAPSDERGGNGYTRTRKHHTSPLFSRRSVEHTAAKRPIDVSKVLV